MPPCWHSQVAQIKQRLVRQEVQGGHFITVFSYVLYCVSSSEPKTASMAPLLQDLDLQQLYDKGWTKIDIMTTLGLLKESHGLSLSTWNPMSHCLPFER